jgi:hypothetical protein
VQIELLITESPPVPIISFLSDLNILLSTLFSSTHGPRTSFNTRNEVSHP